MALSICPNGPHVSLSILSQSIDVHFVFFRIFLHFFCDFLRKNAKKRQKTSKNAKKPQKTRNVHLLLGIIQESVTFWTVLPYTQCGGGLDPQKGVQNPQKGVKNRFLGSKSRFLGSKSGFWGQNHGFWVKIEVFGVKMAKNDHLSAFFGQKRSKKVDFWSFLKRVSFQGILGTFFC